jgi:hypothetical protein
MLWPTICAFPIQERCVCGRQTETIWPWDWRVRTRERTYGDEFVDGGPSSLVT